MLYEYTKPCTQPYPIHAVPYVTKRLVSENSERPK